MWIGLHDTVGVGAGAVAILRGLLVGVVYIATVGAAVDTAAGATAFAAAALLVPKVAGP
jgi:hypothetical protein